MKSPISIAALTGVAFAIAGAAYFTPAAFAAPTAESEAHSIKQTGWGWQYHQTLAQISQYGLQNNVRPFKLIPNGSVEATPRFHVLFVNNSGDYKVAEWQILTRTSDNIANLSAAAFRNAGWRVVNTAWHSYKPDGAPKAISQMAGIAVRDPLYSAYEIRPSLSQTELMAVGKTFRVVDMDVINEGPNTRFTAVIVPNTGANKRNWAWLFASSRGDILKKAEDINGKAYRVSDIHRLSDGTFNVLLVESKGEVSRWYNNLTDTSLKNDALRRHGSWYNEKIEGGARLTNLVYYKDANNEWKRDVITMENGVGVYPIDRDAAPSFKAFDDAFIKTMSRQGTPAASFAIAKNGKVAYRAAYGYSDLDKGTPATRNSTGRLASISKTFTAAAIMKLVDQKSIDLDKPVFGPNGYLKNVTPFDYKNYAGLNVANLNQITTRHLLTHTAGWDRGYSGDPKVTPDTDKYTCDGSTECEPTIRGSQYIAARARLQGTMTADNPRGANADEVTRWMQKPDDADYLPAWKPGAKQIYSNVGYTVLERLIQERTGMSYENYIKQMASTMGVNFYAGNSDPALPVSNEWKYYTTPAQGTISSVYWSKDKLTTGVPSPYIYDMQTMRGHGGWVTSPTDLVKFISKMDGSAPSPWIPNNQFISMIQRPTAIAADDNNYYGLNWGIDTNGGNTRTKFIFGHGGRLGGSSGVSVRGWYHRKASMAILYNSDADATAGAVRKIIEPLMESMDDKNQLAPLGLNMGG